MVYFVPAGDKEGGCSGSTGKRAGLQVIPACWGPFKSICGTLDSTFKVRSPCLPAGRAFLRDLVGQDMAQAPEATWNLTLKT